MEMLSNIVNVLLTPIAGAAEYINVASTSYKKEKQITYFSAVQATLPAEKQQKDEDIKDRARAISELWNQD